MSAPAAIDPQPAELLRRLLRFDTTNPPGNEAGCIGYLQSLLERAGLATEILARDPARPNLLARLPGRGAAPPLLLQGHVDVVTTAGQAWTHPPFAGETAGGMLWGRGALDMKSGIAMQVSALLRARADGFVPPGDVLLAAVSDEECDGEFGAKFLVEQHAGRFAGVRFAAGEGGGSSLRFGGRKFYLIGVGEKQWCSVRATVRGPGGHGSVPRRDGAMTKLAAVLDKLQHRHLPLHVTPAVRRMLLTISRSLPFPRGALVRLVLEPRLADRVLDRLGEAGLHLSAILHHTASPTIVQGGRQVNVLPGEIELTLDGRLLPGYRPADLLAELGALLGDDVALEVTRYDPGPGEADMTLFDLLGDILREADPQGIPLPFVVSGVSDARHFARLGIQTYGYLPADIPDGLWSTIHAADERIPAEAVAWGADRLYRLLQRFGEPFC